MHVPLLNVSHRMPSPTVQCVQGVKGRKDVASQLAKQQRKALLLQQVFAFAIIFNGT